MNDEFNDEPTLVEVAIPSEELARLPATARVVTKERIHILSDEQDTVSDGIPVYIEDEQKTAAFGSRGNGPSVVLR
jgi:hypothetical protein